jgi:hypothetical protein
MNNTYTFEIRFIKFSMKMVVGLFVDSLSVNLSTGLHITFLTIGYPFLTPS